MLDLTRELRPHLEPANRGPRILVIRLGAMGDVLRTLPAVRLIRREHPTATIGWVVDARWEVLLHEHADIDITIPLARSEWKRARTSLTGWPALIHDLRRTRRTIAEFCADLAVDFHGNLGSGWIGRWSGARARLGFSGHQQREANVWFTTHRVPAGERRRSRVERNLDLVEALGIERTPLPSAGLSPTLRQSGRVDAEAILSGRLNPRRYAVLSPAVSSKQAYKKPPRALLLAAIQRLHDHGLQTLVVWGPGEEADAVDLSAAAGSAAVLAPGTTLPTLVALIERATVFVSGDTGPMHLACSLGCPVLALYGPTDPVVNQPWGAHYRALYPDRRRYTGIKRVDRQQGFEGLTEAQVEHALDELLSDVDTLVPAREH